MAFKIVWSSNAKEDLRAVVDYLKEEWSLRITEEFAIETYVKIELLSIFPQLGMVSKKDKSIRRILVTKHNYLYYSINGSNIILLDFFDTRQNPNKNQFE